MSPLTEHRLLENRRQFFSRTSTSVGALGLASLLNPGLLADGNRTSDSESSSGLKNTGPVGGSAMLPHWKPKATRVIYLFQSGGPSQADLYDYKPALADRFGEEVPRSVYPDDRKTTMSSAQASFPVAPSLYRFTRHGQGGAWFSETLPHIASVADELCVVKSMHTEAINHDPAITLWQTGSQIPGRPSIGSWLSYGLGSENADLPAFVAMSSKGSAKNGQPLYDRLWGSGFLPSKHQGVKFRNQGAPVLDIYNPQGIDRQMRRTMLDHLAKLNELKHKQVGDPEIRTRIAQYELAYRMQSSVPDLLDMSDETPDTLRMYGSDVSQQGTYAYNCLVARRLAERGVRFIQLFHQGWDSHGSLPKQVRLQSRDTDQPTAALVKDLKQRGLLDDTILVWGGEFGRTIYSQGKLTRSNFGRDHHAHCFSMWLAGGGIQGGMSYGETDDYSVNAVVNPVHIHDVHATILHLLGIDHERLTFKYQGREFRLTDVHGKIVHPILA